MFSPYHPFVYVINLIVQRLVMQCGTFELWSPHHTGLPVSLSTNGARVDTQHSETLRAERDRGRFFFKRAKPSKERQSGKNDIQTEWRICKYLLPEALLACWSCSCFYVLFGFGSINAENFSEPKSLFWSSCFFLNSHMFLTPLSLDHGGFTLEFRLVGQYLIAV